MPEKPTRVRDVKTNPRPGDEVIGVAVKAKVLSITVTERGISVVEYTVAGTTCKYVEQYSHKVPLVRWTQFCGGGQPVPRMGRLGKNTPGKKEIQ